MAAATFMSAADTLVLPDLGQCRKAEGSEYLEWVSRFVSTHRHKTISLKKPAGALVKIAGLEDTIYSENDDEVNGWGKFYLPDIVNMQVVGVVEGTSCPCDQLVLMTCEDKKLYAYDGEELHLVASSLEQLGDKEIEYPASKSYYNGEAFDDMTEEDWAAVKMGAVGRRLEQEHQQLVLANKSSFMKSLQSAGHS
ncbi:uncharacterized protein LOC111562446 isoform X2 [Amphiprion ocellaris]|nr:uncharacterized protein LOC111562446 isoform X2 [Amphiprion ocellaris]